MLFADFGEKPLCNGHRERAPHIGAFCFPLCWRCTSFAVSSITTTFFLKAIPISTGVCIQSILLSIPCLVDSLLQKYTDYESTNIKRILTGSAAGIGVRLFLYIILNM